MRVAASSRGQVTRLAKLAVSFVFAAGLCGVIRQFELQSAWKAAAAGRHTDFPQRQCYNLRLPDAGFARSGPCTFKALFRI